MELDQINTYFPFDFRCKEKGAACFHIFPETELTAELVDAIEQAIDPVWKRFFPMCLSYQPTADCLCIAADFQYCDDGCMEEIPVNILMALNNIPCLKKVIINDGQTITKEDSEMDNFTEEFEEFEEFDDFDDLEWDEILGLNKLDLYYTAHAEGMDGECFTYAVYFTDGTADEEKADAVRKAIQAFDFKLIDDDYIGYLDISEAEDRLQIYLDLGNVRPQNENKIIHGILLALNSVQGIEKVIVNEE